MYRFLVQICEDGEITFSKKYDSAVDAVRAYDLCRDYGTCRYRREIVLVEPNGKAHSKVFDAPHLVAIG